VGNFLFGSHSRSADRAKNLEAEVARNYAAGVEDRPFRQPTEEKRPARGRRR
jgi:hypothetical protein